jgi:hypothetical protein
MRSQRRHLFLTAALAGGLTSAAAAQSITTLFAGGNAGSAGGIVYFRSHDGRGRPRCDQL